MFHEQFQAGGPVMYAVFGVWVIVLAGVLDRGVYVLGRFWRRPMWRIQTLVTDGDRATAALDLVHERRRSRRGLQRIDAMSQLATSVGLFGTVLGIAHAFFNRAASGSVGPEALGSGLSTALFTTIGGLVVYLFGQGFLIMFKEWLSFSERRLQPVLAADLAELR